jgi:hypothetical protein
MYLTDTLKMKQEGMKKLLKIKVKIYYLYSMLLSNITVVNVIPGRDQNVSDPKSDEFQILHSTGIL